jgi:hypothetical protein
MSIALIRMDEGLRKIGRKISDPHGWKARAERTTPEEITTTQEAIIQIKAEAGTGAKTDLGIACSMRETQTTGQGTAPSS